jgi:PHD/YefM family antitoxin component YafN of YafNO toxin-antitoxin module
MTIYTFSEARQNLSSLLEKAMAEGKVLIRRRDGSVFALVPVPRKSSPLDVKGVDLDLSQEEILEILREVRER